MMPTLSRALVPAAAAALVALPLGAGAQGRPAADTVPTSMLPPAGMCRVWMTGVPASQQPAPTDCITALRQRPANGVVLYGPARKESASRRFDPRVGRGGDSLERALAEEKARRERADRIRRFREMADREQRARDAAAASALRYNAGVRSSLGPGAATGAPAQDAKGGTTPVNAGANAKAAPAQPAPAPAKPPAEPKKPE